MLMLMLQMPRQERYCMLVAKAASGELKKVALFIRGGRGMPRSWLAVRIWCQGSWMETEAIFRSARHAAAYVCEVAADVKFPVEMGFQHLTHPLDAISHNCVTCTPREIYDAFTEPDMTMCDADVDAEIADEWVQFAMLEIEHTISEVFP